MKKQQPRGSTGSLRADRTIRVQTLEENQQRLMNKVSTELTKARWRKGLMQKEMASRLGVSESAISKMLNPRNLTVKSLSDLASAIGAEVDIKVRVPREQEAA